MGLRVIEGGLSNLGGAETGTDRRDVAAEAKRRLDAIGYDRLAARERVTGAAIPAAIRHFRLQVEYVTTILSNLDPVPVDFRADAYWPITPR